VHVLHAATARAENSAQVFDLFLKFWPGFEAKPEAVFLVMCDPSMNEL
jgi:hypothetical protein